MLTQPVINNAFGPAFLWTVAVKVGDKAQNGCSKIMLGGVQSVLSYRATVTWASGTTWLWRVPVRLPARDAVPGLDTPPWYRSDHKFFATNCGDTISVEHGDSPALIAQPQDVPTFKGPASAAKLIPWDDPLGLGKNTVRACQWNATFTAFIIAWDGHEATTVKSIGWALSVALAFDMTQPVGSRTTVVNKANVAVIPAQAKNPIVKGPHPTIKLSQHGSVAEAARIK